jgi:hypothetical protein
MKSRHSKKLDKISLEMISQSFFLSVSNLVFLITRIFRLILIWVFVVLWVLLLMSHPVLSYYCLSLVLIILNFLIWNIYRFR